MAAPEAGGQAVGTLILIIILVSLVRGCDCGSSNRRAPSNQGQRIQELNRSVESLRTRNAELAAAHQESLQEAKRARREAAASSGTATTGILAYGLIGGALLIVSGALGTTLLALRRRRRGGSHG